MSKQYESIMEGLTELLDYAKGDKTKARVRVAETPNIRVKPLKQYSKDELTDIRLQTYTEQVVFL